MYKFLGIGAQKAGTTWLYEMLRQHPDISFPLNKEVHYWNRQYPDRTPEDYFSNFINPTLSEGEITPAYAFLPNQTIQKIYQYQPDLKIIYIIRNPIDRAWSSAKMALKRAEMEFDEASNQWFIDHFQSKNSLLRGDYESCLKTWKDVFPAENILIIVFDEIKNNPESVLQKCCSHIGADDISKQQLRTMNIYAPVFASSSEALNPLLQKYLQELYQEKIMSFGKHLKIDLSTWLE